MNFIVLSSSRGTTFQSSIDAIQQGSLEAKCIGLITDKEDRGCTEKARAAGIPVAITSKNPKEDRQEFDANVHECAMQLIADAGVLESEVLLCEMGWMWIHTPWFISKWQNKILNVHPSLLPKFGGKGMYGDRVHKAVLAAGETESGVSIHIMDTGVDTGRILIQKSCPVLAEDTVESLLQRVQELEKEWYPKTIQMLHSNELRIKN